LTPNSYWYNYNKTNQKKKITMSAKIDLNADWPKWQSGDEKYSGNEADAAQLFNTLEEKLQNLGLLEV
jgi:hypothetical protein